MEGSKDRSFILTLNRTTGNYVVRQTNSPYRWDNCQENCIYKIKTTDFATTSQHLNGHYLSGNCSKLSHYVLPYPSPVNTRYVEFQTERSKSLRNAKKKLMFDSKPNHGLPNIMDSSDELHSRVKMRRKRKRQDPKVLLERRRIKANERESLRRQRFKQAFAVLQSVLPDSLKTDSMRKIDIITKAAEYITILQSYL